MYAYEWWRKYVRKIKKETTEERDGRMIDWVSVCLYMGDGESLCVREVEGERAVDRGGWVSEWESEFVLWEIKEERMEEVGKAWLTEGWWEWGIRDERERKNDKKRRSR